MPQLVRLRNVLSWSNSRQSWQERGSLLLVIAGAAVLLWFRDRLALSRQVLLWGLLAALAAVLFRRGWLRLFGPVLFYDLVRIGRRGRYFLFRSLYAAFLLFLIVWMYLVWVFDSATEGYVQANEMASFAASFFYLYLGVQFSAVVLLTPAYVAGAVAEEKERRTFEFLLATDLRNREIVLSKLAARVANLLMIVLTGLPVLSLLQFLGGVDPNLVLAGFAATGMTLAGLAGLSILCSIWAKKPRDAIALTYLAAGAYLILSAMSLLLLIPDLELAQWPSTNTWASPVTVEDLVHVFNSGNVVTLYFRLDDDLTSGGRLDNTIPTLLRDYTLFCGLVAIVCATWAVSRMRAVALKQMYGTPQKATLGARLWGRPRVGRRPMLWKEVFIEPGLRLNWFGKGVMLLLLLASFVPGVWIAAVYVPEMLTNYGSSWQDFGTAMNVWVRTAGMIVECLLLLAVAVRAASSVGGERDRQTFDSLLTSPLESNSILFAKWVGSVLSVRWLWLWLGGIWGMGLVSNGLHPLAVPLVVMAWFIYAGFVAAVGLWFSVACRTTLRATVWTLAAAVGGSVGHWFVLTLCFYIPIQKLASGLEEELTWVPEFHLFGLTPPFTMWCLALQGWEFEERWFFSLGVHETWRYSVFGLVGLAFWATAGILIWLLAAARFRALTGRKPLRRPQKP